LNKLGLTFFINVLKLFISISATFYVL